jgi:hypothetical protein
MVKRSRTKSRKLRKADGKAKANLEVHEMCLIHLDFKHFRSAEGEDFRQHGKVSSIMRAKVLSIMPIERGPVTAI